MTLVLRFVILTGARLYVAVLTVTIWTGYEQLDPKNPVSGHPLNQSSILYKILIALFVNLN